jgi:hypothetical protein
MTAAISLIGQRFGMLVVKAEELRANPVWHHPRTWCVCQCDCGREHGVWRQSIQQGLTKSCGCLRRRDTRERNHARRGMKRNGAHE